MTLLINDCTNCQSDVLIEFVFRYFQMVVGLYAAVRGEETFLLTALMSEKIIVRVRKHALNQGGEATGGNVKHQFARTTLKQTSVSWPKEVEFFAE